ncbi:SAM-dependent methyltransferase [Endozoicomonas montiporae]|uniref:SAM-dependent methyltransferase n=2 Tax=Endozoicomonas montiporae TaxID=1027273 RepID=A0A081N1S7_9GAMM|nr:class I SAM-dependent rRNA methyltransferase [Endozoicomonas montiporae]AMO58658.1 ribosomal RNA large subunit methyltransferase I [Endozoicomonas montiporae CL-33]KEQ12400.1 SAM-dependent methyltransferase [Endozoicomonas montiporae]
MTHKALRLKDRADRRLKAGHLWIYSNEVDTKATPLKGFETGELVAIENAAGKAIGTGYVNPNTLICARLVSRDAKYMLDKSLLVHRVKVALSLRERLFDKPYYRLIFGDSDSLPGLVVDRFGDVLVVQISTAGMEAVKDQIVEALVQVLKPTGVLLKNDGTSRKLENLPEYIEVAHGEVADEVELEENGVRFLAPVMKGQKTGWFYDHRLNRDRLRHYVKGKRVLDVFSYVGGWGVQCAAFGAEEVICVDASEKAVDLVHRNAELNGLQDKVGTMQGDAFEALKQLKAEGEQFDVIIVDPPAFIKRRKDVKAGELAYRRINEMAMRLLGKDGILVACSCSMHLQRDSMLDALRAGSRHIERTLQIIEQGHQGPDHPILPAIPETEYIKAMTARITRV